MLNKHWINERCQMPKLNISNLQIRFKLSCRTIRMLNRSLLLFLVLLYSQSVYSAESEIDQVRENRVPGGIAIIPISKAHTMVTPYVTYKHRRTLVIDGNFIWYAIVGIPLSASPGEHSILIERENNKPRTITFTVKPKEYKTQHITLKDKRKVNPYKKDLVRINKEKKQISDAFLLWTATVPEKMLFTLPVSGRLSSPFGLRRFFNKQARKPHSGIDIAAPKGTELKAPSSGTIVTTGEYFFNGKSVFINHGMGLISMFCHMDNIAVKEGQKIKQGETFGTIGMTGRATGPHVHWSVSLNNTRVDPNLFFPQGITAELSK